MRKLEWSIIFFYVISRHFWIEFPCPRDFQKHNPEPRSAPYEFDHDISIPSPDGRISLQRRFSTEENEG
jgi:hypothetical protein